MDLTSLFTFLQSIQPIGVIALLGIIIFQLVQNQKGQKKIATNHLHDLPEMVETLRRIETQLDKLDDIKEGIAVIKERIK